MLLFFLRYLFRKALIEDEIAHQEAVEKKEKREKEMTEESLQWEKGDSLILANNLIIVNNLNLRLTNIFKIHVKS